MMSFSQTTLSSAMLTIFTLYDVPMVNVTGVDGVYTSDPSVDQDARMYKTLDYSELRRATGMSEAEPGVNVVMDRSAIDILEQSGMELRVVSGDDLENLGNAVEGEDFIGTRVAVGLEMTFL